MFSKLATSDPHSYAGDAGAALGSPATTKEAARAWAHGQDWARARTQAPASSFAVAENPKAAPGSPAYVCGSKVANLGNFYVVDFQLELPGYKLLPGYPVTENLELPGSLFLPG